REVAEADAARISAHLTTCARCTSEFESLTAEEELFARYDRELSIPPAMWNAIEARTAAESRAIDPGSRATLREGLAGLFAAPRLGYAALGALAVLMVAMVFGLMYLRMQQHPPEKSLVRNDKTIAAPGKETRVIPPPPVTSSSPVEEIVARRKTAKPTGHPIKADDPGVLFTDIAYSDLAERDTAEHIQQAENLLRSIRSLAADDDSEIDVSYEKAMSRRLLSENVVLRHDAQMAGKFPTKELLGDLEPFLIDISNLPDKTTPDKLRVIKDRVQKTEIVAALVSY
ncbi:MAG: hypothetical protein QOF72_2273, partial [Blastocatellia bacterium]|nr:hypothetical protein [Blastocatellia bacterium]